MASWISCQSVSSIKSWTLLLIVGVYLTAVIPVSDSQPAAEPHCVALDNLIDHILRSMRSMTAATVICAKIPGCTGIRCSFSILGQSIGMSLRMYPCATPAQMRIRIFIPSSGINFSQMITHGTTIALPGFQYSPFPGIKVRAQAAVHFDKVPEGLRIGILFQARGFGTGINWPVLPDYTVTFPPCSTAIPVTEPPPTSQCGKMDVLLAGVATPPGFTCTVYPDCLGFHCFGSINAVILTYSVNISLTINNCNEPVSYTIALTNPGSPLIWQHTFFQSDTVPVIASFPGRTKANLTVFMRHFIPEGYIETSIKVTICIGVIACFDLPFMSAQRVPIAPCTTGTGPLPLLEYILTEPNPIINTPACQSWKRVENSLKTMGIPGLTFPYCYIEAPLCNHIMCTVNYQSLQANNTYSIYAEVKHCAQPMHMMVSIQGINTAFFIEQSISIDKNVTLNQNGVILTADFRRHGEAIMLSVAVIIPNIGPATGPLNLPLITNQIIDLPICANGGGAGPETPVGPPQFPPDFPVPEAPRPGADQPAGGIGVTQEPKVTKPKRRNPIGNAKSTNSAVPLAIGLLFTVLAIIAAVFGAFYWYRQPNTTPTEEAVLVDEGEHETVRFSIGAR
ncbi:uncharacterized protein [Asterias amurensis]|uniref:uncharacterized protein isoform X1 n=1 Tax=Asterias amurensis TaxID=7602 RepID=UPI003AB77719